MERSMSLCTVVNCMLVPFRVGGIISYLLVYRYVLGHEAMKRMGSSNVLVVGLKGLGAEIGE